MPRPSVYISEGNWRCTSHRHVRCGSYYEWNHSGTDILVLERRQEEGQETGITYW
uniref:Uncharacterized protein n=1 Tax=Ascaris lumbricoides TaxID=6252 RepID=A0A0M3IQA6_ASCLU